MATLLRGKYRGTEVTIHQWCNDWFTLDEQPQVVSPLSLKLNEEEVARVQASFDNYAAGIMPALYELRPDGTFRKRR